MAKQRQVDGELLRIAGLIKTLDELNDRCWKLQRDYGSAAYERALRYVKERRVHVLNRFDRV